MKNLYGYIIMASAVVAAGVMLGVSLLPHRFDEVITESKPTATMPKFDLPQPMGGQIHANDFVPLYAGMNIVVVSLRDGTQCAALISSTNSNGSLSCDWTGPKQYVIRP